MNEMKDVENMDVKTMVLKLTISNILDDLGVPRGRRARSMLKDTIYYSVTSERLDTYPSMNEIYISIGRSFYPDGTSDKIYSRVERSIRHILGTVYSNPHTKMWDRLFCNYKPSNSEFIMTCSDMIASGEYDINTYKTEDDNPDNVIDIGELKYIIRHEIRNTIRECVLDFFGDTNAAK